MPETNKSEILTKEKSLFPEVAGAFNLGRVLSFSQTMSGIANHVYFLTTDKGNFVAKFLIWQKMETVANDVAISQQLNGDGVTCPEYMPMAAGKYLLKIEGMKVVVTKKVPGIHPKGFGPKLTEEMGRALAVFHTQVKFLPFKHRNWLSRTEKIKIKKVSLQRKLVEEIKEQIQTGQDVFKYQMPTGMIHGDFSEENVLVWENNQERIAAMLDFEEAEEEIYIVDIARTLLGVCQNSDEESINLELVKALIGGYEKIKSLTSEEKKGLAKAVAYVAGTGGSWFVNHGFDKYAQQWVNRSRDFDRIWTDKS